MRSPAKFLAICLVAECLLSKCSQNQAGQALPVPDGAGGISVSREDAEASGPPDEAVESAGVSAPVLDRGNITEFRRASPVEAGESG